MNRAMTGLLLVLMLVGRSLANSLALGADTEDDAIGRQFGPPPEGGYKSYSAELAAEHRATEVLIPKVPGYHWHRGCAPTCGGMLIGYWDTQGLNALIPGDPLPQLQQVNDVIANDLHYRDYSMPLDAHPNLFPDLSELPLGDEHESNCLADFMHTSWSIKGVYYGYTISWDVDDGLLDYVRFINRQCGTTYAADSHLESWASNEAAWDHFVEEINSGRPLMLFVDTDGDGVADHAVTAIGYRHDDLGGQREYACFDTWGTSDQFRWELFRQRTGPGMPFSIDAAVFFDAWIAQCGDAQCDTFLENQCNCPIDCGIPPTAEAPDSTCVDGIDNDCDGLLDCEDPDCSVSDPVCACDNDGVCETVENCHACPNDCFTGSAAVCGNNICEINPIDGEDCLSCPEDCPGMQTGDPSEQYCCGDGDGFNPVNCADFRCGAFAGGPDNDCFFGATPGGSCCGDGLCEDSEDQFNCAVDCSQGSFCGDSICNPNETQCDCPTDCGAPPVIETNCTDLFDNDCDGFTDCDDEDCMFSAPSCLCNSNGVCDGEEDCLNCPTDCIMESGAVCGNDICEINARDGEDCLSCPQDCPGVQTGDLSGQYCCGDGDGVNPVNCADVRCGAFVGGPANDCVFGPAAGGSCCGDEVCEGNEDRFNCWIDCENQPYCGDAYCDSNESSCDCPEDCGMPPATETQCSNGIDDDCDMHTDCIDRDCAMDPVCITCLPTDAECRSDEACCSGRCQGRRCR